MNYFKFFYKSLFRRFKAEHLEKSSQNHADKALEVNCEEVALEKEQPSLVLAVAEQPLKTETPAYLNPNFGKVVFRRKPRKITYTFSTKDGELLYSGTKLRIFMKKEKLDKQFSFSSAYNFASRHQGAKVFKDKYIITLKES